MTAAWKACGFHQGPDQREGRSEPLMDNQLKTLPAEGQDVTQWRPALLPRGECGGSAVRQGGQSPPERTFKQRRVAATLFRWGFEHLGEALLLG
jgi:hypothetical protein